MAAAPMPLSGPRVVIRRLHPVAVAAGDDRIAVEIVDDPRILFGHHVQVPLEDDDRAPPPLHFLPDRKVSLPRAAAVFLLI